jgi:hypothetical protein
MDEHIPGALARGMQRQEPDVQIFVVGQANAPKKHTNDSDLLLWVEKRGCFLVTNNRASMPDHLREHLAAGNHIPGILVVPRRLSLRMVIDELLLIWGASIPGEFQDQIVYLPRVK